MLASRWFKERIGDSVGGKNLCVRVLEMKLTSEEGEMSVEMCKKKKKRNLLREKEAMIEKTGLLQSL